MFCNQRTCILKKMSIFAAPNRICGEICLLATTLKNAKIICDICVFVTAPHVMWGFYCTLTDCHPERSDGSLTRN